jgi:predicted  nucleic acid-binding Zn-ribbon protein
VSEEHECLDCGFVFEAEADIIDGGVVDTHCPRCGAPIVIGESEAERSERRRREQFRESLNDRLSRIADMANEPDYIGPRYSLEELSTEILAEIERIQTELQRRENKK